MGACNPLFSVIGAFGKNDIRDKVEFFKMMLIKYYSYYKELDMELRDATKNLLQEPRIVNTVDEQAPMS